MKSHSKIHNRQPLQNFNRTIKELKFLTHLYSFFGDDYFNRTIKELKSGASEKHFTRIANFNRTIKELKSFDADLLKKIVAILIAPLRN